MKIEKIDINKISPYKLNCKKHNKKNIEAIKLSLEKFQQYSPLIVSKKNNEIIIGNGTYLALKQLNFKQVFVLFLDLTDQQQKILNISDNKTSQLSSWNQKLLQKIQNFDQFFKQILDFDDDFLKKLEKTQKNKEEKLDILKNDVILNDSNQILVNKQEFLKCPCCGKEFLKQ